MALKATIFKANLQMTDIDRHYYEAHALTIARHPSETDERMMMRVFAFARHASAALVFGKGWSDGEEPDLWCKDPTGAITLWIDVGQPDERRLLKACGRAAQVVVIAYGGTVPVWWAQMQSKVARAQNLTVIRIAPATSLQLAALATRTMQLQCTIEDGDMWLGDGERTVQIEQTVLRAAR